LFSSLFSHGLRSVGVNPKLEMCRDADALC
jgi:hypothetical protein